MNHIKSIALNYYIYECCNTELRWHCESFSNNSSPGFTDEALLTIYIYVMAEEEKFKVKSIYDFTGIKKLPPSPTVFLFVKTIKEQYNLPRLSYLFFHRSIFRNKWTDVRP